MSPPARRAAGPARSRLLLLALVLLQAIVAALLLDSLGRLHDWGVVYGEDSHGYLVVARYFQGEGPEPEDQALLRYRLFNPLLPALAGWLGRGVGIEAVFLSLNLLLWIAATLGFHELLRRWEGEREAWAGAVMLATALPFIEWGLPVMLDAGAWATAVGALLLYAVYREGGIRAAALLGAGGGLAVLVKPTLASLAAFLAAARLRDRRPAQALLVGALALAGPLVVYLGLGLGAQDFFAFGSPRHRGALYVLSAAFFCFHWGWWLAWRGWRQGGREDGTYALYLASFLPFFLPFVHSPRLFFVAFPAILALAARGAVGLERQAGGVRLPWLLGAWVLTSNALAALHLYVMRTLGIRNLEQLGRDLGGWW
jgi:4-amino-4-deoxy-L-arabinose transferase-like glycosyltransferase